MEARYADTLTEFLNMPLDRGDQILERFASLPSARVGNGQAPLQRYVYVPGTRNDRVLLIAHVDTVWDRAYGCSLTQPRGVLLEDGVFKSDHPGCGIGADDRAGCAMLWEMRHSGHSLLLLDGEEKGKQGAIFLRRSNPALFRELNQHNYMVELDWRGQDECMLNQAPNTARFQKHMKQTLGMTATKARASTDLQVICKRICGINVGVGYHGYHTAQETLVLSEWQAVLDKLSRLLASPQPRFRAHPLVPLARYAKYYLGKLTKRMKKKPHARVF